MKKIFVALPVVTLLVSGFSYSTADARSALGELPVYPDSNPTSEVKPKEKPKQEEVVENNGGSAIGHLPSNPDSTPTPESSSSIHSKITILEAYAGENTIKVEHPADDLTLNFYRNNKYEGSGSVYYFFYRVWGNRASFNYPGEALKPGDILRVDTKDSFGLVTKGKEFSVSDMGRPEDKVTVNNLNAGKNVTIEGETMENAWIYEIYVNGKKVTYVQTNKFSPDVYSVQVPNLNKGDIVTVLAKDISESGNYTHGSVTTTVQ
ncbi:hypothetical protein [Bacillus sp. mrc49]|uniref:hypothetical protein n=1 Tax=Bacillus sp. mrc49 TaxID=2054913 RepID=UPI000C27B9B6|nr:hypothetical protein [Bacillus sp. mrc49]PJN90290.1 hypothetical protein CVN76_11120 [Bacillus sp. mrc49]